MARTLLLMSLLIAFLIFYISCGTTRAQPIEDSYLFKRSPCANGCWGKYEQCIHHEDIQHELSFKVCVLAKALCMESCSLRGDEAYYK